MKNVKVNMELKTLTISEVNYQCKSKSEMFKILYTNNYEISQIAKLTNSHYSFIYGVIQNSCKIRQTVKNSKSDQFRKLNDSGLTVGEIAKQTNSNYSFVFSVIKKYKNSEKIK